jgi:histidine racemase
MREIDFVKCSPTQNMTILVKTAFPMEEHSRIAAAVMAYDHVHAEQVGFIDVPSASEAAASLQMAGGEFCGNACMALAAVLASEEEISGSNWTEFAIEASGAEGLITCQVVKSAEHYVCRLDMPHPRKIEQTTVRFEEENLQLVMVRYENGLHLVIEVEQFSSDIRRKAERLARLIGVTLGAGLIGILLFSPENLELEPLIYVPSIDSMLWERGCGSGTASLGAYLSWKSNGTVTAPIKQAGGIIHVRADWDKGRITSLKIEGNVRIVAKGKAFIDT